MSASKPFTIDKWQVYKAYQAVKANAGSAGVDGQSLKMFEKDLKANLYKIWNRMSSGCYFPPPVKAVAIPKKSGGERILGVPTVADRVAQMVVKQEIEPEIEATFLPDSYGYRPGRSALDAIGVTRERCWRYDWVLEFDIKGLFDNIDHALLLRAVEKHVKCRWALLYIKRWLIAPLQLMDGTLVERTQGTPQGGVISPILANLFLHYTFDVWMSKYFPGNPWCRYADDGLVHCRTEGQAQAVRSALDARFKECALEMHPDKTKIAYCKDNSRRKDYPVTEFDFLGYTFRPRWVLNRKRKSIFLNFTPAVSSKAVKAMRQKTRKLNFRNRTELSLADISTYYNPVLRGWLTYYGHYYRSAMYPVFRHFNKTLVAWAMRKYKRLKGHKIRASRFIEQIAQKEPHLFVHWQKGMVGAFA
ncbi:group II intron reverse transcriptase/maturase [Desulfogranum marinum]|uniref:group II intron reverse transcriptase/maturase n=1 Tax=Desulfogranum marinum TaxID=453220 RepID=UPI001962356C|nr:group II intron reverse transcriptase/maturase [Desulfogranum marinum]MBM9513781.1 group II intron reverse transcriptase/maturase [Desulfogranum marinum]